MFFFGTNPILELLIFAAFGLSIWAQFKVKGNFRKWSQVAASSGITGAQVARHLLNQNGLYDVDVEPVRGTLSDHYDPVNRAVRLSEDVYYGNSIASIAIASHEVGHAIQHKEAYSMLVLRHKFFPILNFTSGIAPILLIAGFLFRAANLIGLGIIFFATVVIFHLITLPVEFNASSRARNLIVAEGFIRNEEEKGIGKVLNAAALTYVAAALIAALELLRYILIFVGMNSDD
ncbi:peptidase [Vulcanibacillus modesticaldus]|uniref:Peptidase n=1 Tax=Vulcanibacillus modesticaldus TaxID=337097 RepID=A0A1D2YVV6_9BACI|nr:zinc metallopeptidase [Vulcanibacillus modesticaldus]OEF99868.1 peptidase [Vulcanibacillus modesticaldus]